MRAVVNATPLVAFAVLGRLDLLHRMFDDVIVPATVYAETVTRAIDRPGAAAIAQADWLHIASAQASPTIEPMLLGLDAGEMEVLLLAREMQPDWVLIDDRQARRVARAMGLPVKGTLGILLASALAGWLSKEEALAALQQLTHSGIHISPIWQSWFRDELEKGG